MGLTARSPSQPRLKVYTKQPEASVGGTSPSSHDGPSDPVWQSCGQHRFYVHEDLLFWKGRGAMEGSDIKALFDERVAVQSRHGHVVVLVDAYDIDNVPAEGRRYAAQMRSDMSIRGAVVVFGAGVFMQTLVALIRAAARVLGRQDSGRLFFASDEAEAWALVEREQSTWRAAQKSL